MPTTGEFLLESSDLPQGGKDRRRSQMNFRQKKQQQQQKVMAMCDRFIS